MERSRIYGYYRTTAYANQLMLCIYASLMVFTPFIKYQRMIILSAVFAVWFLTTIMMDRKWYCKREAFNMLILIIIMFIMDCFLGAISNDSSVINKFVTHKIILFSWAYMYIYYSDKIELLKVPLVVIVIMVTISTIFTLIGNIQYPGASRMLANTLIQYNSERDLYRNINIGGYDFIYGIVFLVSPLILVMKKSEKFKVIIAADIVLICLTIIVSSYTIAILLMVALIISVLVLPTNKRNYIIVISAAILCVLVFKESILDLLTAFGRAINSDILVKRLTEIKTMSYIEDYGEESRIAIYHNAWLNYLDRPFLGALQGTKIIYRRSGHSSLLDYLEKYGILSVIYLIYYVEVYKMTAKRIEKMAYKNGYIIYYALFMLLLAFNYSDSSYALACIVYFVAPGILLNLDCRTQKENC